ncbi:MAG TPA: GlsB/YeaQ/YmgE family stress response membrane protein [Abditibacteriaceae bacterium]|jgi:uncharacterized membrane protein YeaQ/YmgE (transglycosylase-associated protein family)
MTVWDFLLLLLVAAIIGSIGQAIAGYSTPGCAMSIVIGFVGAFIGRWLQAQFKLPMFLPVRVGGTTFPVIWSVIGAVLLVLVLRLVLGRRGTVAN